MSHAQKNRMMASLPTFLVYEERGVFAQYAGAGKHPVCVYDRERVVLEAARRVAEVEGFDSIRVVFIIPCMPSGQNTPPPPLMQVKR